MKKIGVFFEFILIIFFSFLVLASHIILPSSFSINQTTSNLFNISVNNTDVGEMANITQVNITFPSSGIFVDSTNGTNSKSLFSNNSNILSWTNFSKYVVNGSSINYFWFNLSNLLPGDYNITLNTTNSTDSYVFNISLEVNDTVNPVSSLGLNPVEYFNSSSRIVLFNLSCSDNYNISSIFLYGNWSGNWSSNYSNFSYSNNSWLNISVSNIEEGYYNWGIYCNDSAVNYDWSSNRTLVIDTTDPALSYSCSPSSVNSGGAMSCTCSGSDDGSGFNSSSLSYTSNPSTSNTGTYSISCTGSDYSGNSKTKTISYSITGSGSVNSNDQDSPEQNSSEQNNNSEQNSSEQNNNSDISFYQEKIINQLTIENNTVISEFDNRFSIDSINLSVNKEIFNLNFSLHLIDGNSSELLSKKSGHVLNYFHINPGNLTDSLNYAILTIRVNREWLKENNLTREDVALFKLNEDSKKWMQLDTVYKEGNEDYFYYETKLDGFSYFVISEKSHVINQIWLWVFIGLAILFFIAGIIISFKYEKK